MRKLKIKSSEKDRNRITAIIFLVLLVFSVFGYGILNSFSSNDGSGDSSDVGKQGNYWVFEKNGQRYFFSYSFDEVSNISLTGNYSLNDYSDVPLYFTEDNQGSVEILNNIYSYVSRSQNACLSQESCADNLPVKNCSVDNVIVFIDGDNSVSKKENCVYISGDPVKGADRFLYEVLKIN